MNLNKYKQILKVGILPAFLILLASFANAQTADDNLRKLATAMQIIRYAYVDTINEAKLVENAKSLNLNSKTEKNMRRLMKQMIRTEKKVIVSFGK